MPSYRRRFIPQRTQATTLPGGEKCSLPENEQSLIREFMQALVEDIAVEILISDALADRERLTHEFADPVISLRVRRKHQWFDLGDFK